MIICGAYPNSLTHLIFDNSPWYLFNYFNWFVPTGTEMRSNALIWRFFKV